MNNDTHETTEDQQKVGSFERHVPKARMIFVLAIASTFIASVVLLIAGAVETFKIVYELIFGLGMTLSNVKYSFLEVIDEFLVATILYVIASGFYQLFLNPRVPVDPWLKVRTVGDLENKLIGVFITVLGVTGLGAVVTWDGKTDLLPFGATVSLLIAALAFFLSRSRHD